MKRLLFTLALAGMIVGGLPATASAASSQTAKYVCLIVLDGGKPEYITSRLNQLPNVKKLMQHGRWYNNAFVGSLMSITPPDHLVIGTGSFPKDDGGVVNWDWGLHNVGKISPTFQAIESYTDNYAYKLIKNSGTPTLAGMIHKKYPKGIVMAGSGAHFHAAGPMGGPDANWIFAYQRSNGYWAPFTISPGRPVPKALLKDPSLREKIPSSNDSTVPFTYDPLVLGHQDSLVMKFAIKALQKDRPRAMLLNLAEVDTVGHWSQKWKKEEGRLYKAFDQNLGQLIAAYKKAGIYNQTLFVITADHGMIQSKNRVLDREAVVAQIKSTLGHSSIILTNGGGAAGPTMTSIWLKDPANNERMAKAIFAKNYDNVSAIYYATNTNGHYQYKMAGCNSCSPALVNAYNYLMSTDAGPTGEDIAILLRENARNSGMPEMPGRHGGADWGSQHVTLLLSGPGVQDGTSNHPARLTDVAPTIERFMGITPDARDGIVLADAFQNPNPSDVSAQNASDATLTPIVNALQSRAASDIRLEAAGKLANFVPSNEVIIHWKRRWAVTIAGAVVLLGTVIFLAWAVAEVRRQGTGLKWTA
jgi:predicted AlkP superfamily pyrophosphatase or phosphodiesterase